jgi:hypothetical protein
MDVTIHSRARSSAGEHYLDMVGVTGSIPVAPTIFFNGLRAWRSVDEKMIHELSTTPST